MKHNHLPKLSGQRKRNPHRSLFSFLLAFLLCTGFALPSSAQMFTEDFRFFQCDRYDVRGRLLFANSSLAGVHFQYLAHPTQTYYVNIVAVSATRRNVWIVKNLPVFSRALGNTSGRLKMAFDLKALGYAPGKDVTSLRYAVVTGPNVLATIPAVTPTQTAAVANKRYQNEISHVYKEATMMAGIAVNLAMNDPVKNKDMPGVQENPDQCMPGSMARSIAWLNTKYSLGCSLTAEQIDSILESMNTTGNLKDFLPKKAKFLDSISGGRGTTEILDVAGTANIPGIPELRSMLRATPVDATSPTVEDVLKDKLGSSDIEMGLRNAGDTGHFITVTGYFDSAGKKYIRFRDDETQGDDAAGDEGEKTGEINPDGSVTLDDGSQWKVEVLVVESIKPAANRVVRKDDQPAVPPPAFNGISLLSNSPNPFRTGTLLRIQCDRDDYAGRRCELVIRNSNGTVLQRIPVGIRIGLNQVSCNPPADAGTVLFCTLEIDGQQVQTRRMLRH